MKEFIWILTERNDKFELPIFVAETCSEMADKLGISVNAVNKRLRENNQKHCKYIISKIEV